MQAATISIVFIASRYHIYVVSRCCTVKHVSLTRSTSLCPKHAPSIFGTISKVSNIVFEKSDKGSFPDLCQFRTQLRLAHKESAKSENE